MSKTRVLIAVPVGKQFLAGTEYVKASKRAADVDSFTRGFFEGGDSKNPEWAIASWYIDKTNVALFDSLIAAFPEAKVDKWDDDKGDIDPAARLKALGGLGIAPIVYDALGNVAAVKADASIDVKAGGE